MSFAARARAHREEGGAFVFPEFEGWVRLKAWKFGLSKKKNPMFTLEFKIIEAGDLKGKIIKDRTVISSAADWQFDRFLPTSRTPNRPQRPERQGPEVPGHPDALEFLEDKPEAPGAPDPPGGRHPLLPPEVPSRWNAWARAPAARSWTIPRTRETGPRPLPRTRAPRNRRKPRPRPPARRPPRGPDRTAATASRPATTTTTRTTPPASTAGKAGGRKPWEKGSPPTSLPHRGLVHRSGRPLSLSPSSP
jgi:hypothetical protein